MDYNISSSAFDTVLPAPLTNEVPHLSIWNILNRQNQTEWAKDYYGRTITQYGDFDSIKVIGNVRSNNYQSDAITYVSTDGEQLTGYIPKINFMVDGGFEIEADYFMHELVKQLGRLYPEHPNAILNLTPSERKSYWNQAEHMINSFFDLDNIAFEGDVEEFYLKTKFLENITAVRKYCGLPEEESMLTRLIGIPSVFTGAAEYVDDIGNKIIVYEKEQIEETELHKAYTYSSKNFVTVVDSEELAIKLEDNFRNFNGVDEVVERLSGLNSLTTYAYADATEYAEYVVGMLNNILKYNSQVTTDVLSPMNTATRLSSLAYNEKFKELLANYNPSTYNFTGEDYIFVLGKDTSNGFVPALNMSEAFDLDLIKDAEGKLFFKQTKYEKVNENNMVKFGAIRYNETFLRNYTQACLSVYNNALGPNTQMRNKIKPILNDMAKGSIAFYVQFRMYDADDKLVCGSILRPDIFTDGLLVEEASEGQEEKRMSWLEIAGASMNGLSTDILPERYWLAVENTDNVENMCYEAGDYKISVTLNVLQTPFDSLKDFEEEITIATNTLSKEVTDNGGSKEEGTYEETIIRQMKNYDPELTAKGIIILPAEWEEDVSWYVAHPELLTEGSTMISDTYNIVVGSIFNCNVIELELEGITSIEKLVTSNSNVVSRSENVEEGEKTRYYLYVQYELNSGEVNVSPEDVTKAKIISMMSAGSTAEPLPMFKTSGKIVDATTIAVQDSVVDIINRNNHTKCMVVDSLGQHYYGEVNSAVIKNTECYISFSSIEPNLNLDLDNLSVIVCLESSNDYISQLPDVEAIEPKRRKYTARAANYQGRYFYAVNWETLSDANLIYYLSNLYNDTTKAYIDTDYLSTTGLKDPTSLTRVEGVTVVECSDEQLSAVEAILEENKSLYIDSSMKRFKHVPLLQDTTAYCAESGSLVNSVRSGVPAKLIMYEGLDTSVGELGGLVDSLKDVDVRDIEFVTELVGKSLVVWGNTIWDNNGNSDLANFRTIWSNYFADFEVKSLDRYFPTNNDSDSTLSGTRQHTIALDNYNYSYNDGNPAGHYNLVFSPADEMVNHPSAVITNVKFIPAEVIETREFTGPTTTSKVIVNNNFMWSSVADTENTTNSINKESLSLSQKASETEVNSIKFRVEPAKSTEVIKFTEAKDKIVWVDENGKSDIVSLSNYTLNSFGNFFTKEDESKVPTGGFQSRCLATDDVSMFANTSKLFAEFISLITHYTTKSGSKPTLADIKQYLEDRKDENYYQCLIDVEGSFSIATKQSGANEDPTKKAYLIRYHMDGDTIVASFMYSDYHPCILKLLFTDKTTIPVYKNETVSPDSKEKFIDKLKGLNGELLVCIPANEYTVRFTSGRLLTKGIDPVTISENKESLVYTLNALGPNRWLLNQDSNKDKSKEGNIYRPQLLVPKNQVTYSSEVDLLSQSALNQMTYDIPVCANSEDVNVNVYTDDNNLIHYERGNGKTTNEFAVEIGTSFKFFSDYVNVVMDLSLENTDSNASKHDSIITFDQPLSDKDYMFFWDIKPVAERTSYTPNREIQVVDRSCELNKLPVIGMVGEDKLLVRANSLISTNVEGVVSDVAPIDENATHDLSEAEVTLGKYFKSTTELGIDYTYYKRKFATSGSIASSDKKTFILATEGLHPEDYISAGDQLHLIFFDNLQTSGDVTEYTFSLDSEMMNAILGGTNTLGVDEATPLNELNYKLLGVESYTVETNESGDAAASITLLIGVTDGIIRVSFRGINHTLDYQRKVLATNGIKAPLNWFVVSGDSGNEYYASDGARTYRLSGFSSLETIDGSITFADGSGNSKSVADISTFSATNSNSGDKWVTFIKDADWIKNPSAGKKDYEEKFVYEGYSGNTLYAHMDGSPIITSKLAMKGTTDTDIIIQYLEARFTELKGDELVIKAPSLIAELANAEEDQAQLSDKENSSDANAAFEESAEAEYFKLWFEPQADGLTVANAIQQGFVKLPSFDIVTVGTEPHYELANKIETTTIVHKKGDKVLDANGNETNEVYEKDEVIFSYYPAGTVISKADYEATKAVEDANALKKDDEAKQDLPHYFSTKDCVEKYEPLKNDAGEIVYKVCAPTETVYLETGKVTTDVVACASVLSNIGRIHSGKILVSETASNGLSFAKLDRESTEVEVYNLSSDTVHRFNLSSYLGVLDPQKLDLSKPHTLSNIIYDAGEWKLLKSYVNFLKAYKAEVIKYIGNYGGAPTIKSYTADRSNASLTFLSDDMIDAYYEEATSRYLRKPKSYETYEDSTPYSFKNYLTALVNAMIAQTSAASNINTTLMQLSSTGGALFGSKFPKSFEYTEVSNLAVAMNNLAANKDPVKTVDVPVYEDDGVTQKVNDIDGTPIYQTVYKDLGRPTVKEDFDSVAWNSKIEVVAQDVTAKGNYPLSVEKSWESMTGSEFTALLGNEYATTVPVALPDEYNYGQLKLNLEDPERPSELYNKETATKGIIGDDAGEMLKNWKAWVAYEDAGKQLANTYTKYVAQKTVRDALSKYSTADSNNATVFKSFDDNIKAADANLKEANTWRDAVAGLQQAYKNKVKEAETRADTAAEAKSNLELEKEKREARKRCWDSYSAAVNKGGALYTDSEFYNAASSATFKDYDGVTKCITEYITLRDVWNTCHGNTSGTYSTRSVRRWYKPWTWWSEDEKYDPRCTNPRIRMNGSNGYVGNDHWSCPNSGSHYVKGAAWENESNPAYYKTITVGNANYEAQSANKEACDAAVTKVNGEKKTAWDALVSHWNGEEFSVDNNKGLDYENTKVTDTCGSGSYYTQSKHYKKYLKCKAEAQALINAHYKFKDYYKDSENAKLNVSHTNNKYTVSKEVKQSYNEYNYTQAVSGSSKAKRKLILNIVHDMGDKGIGDKYIEIRDNGSSVSYTNHLVRGAGDTNPYTFEYLWTEAVINGTSKGENVDNNLTGFDRLIDDLYGSVKTQIAAVNSLRKVYVDANSKFNTDYTKFLNAMQGVNGNAKSDFRVPGITTSTGQWQSSDITKDFTNAIITGVDTTTWSADAARAQWSAVVGKYGTPKTNNDLKNEKGAYAYEIYYTGLCLDWSEFFSNRQLDYESCDSDWTDSYSYSNNDDYWRYSFIDLPAQFTNMAESLHMTMSEDFLYIYGNMKNYSSDVEAGTLAESLKVYINQGLDNYLRGENWNCEYVPFVFRYCLSGNHAESANAFDLELARLVNLPTDSKILGMTVKDGSVFIQWEIAGKYLTSITAESPNAAIALPEDLNELTASELDNSLGLYIADAASYVTIDDSYKATGLVLDASALQLPTIYKGTVSNVGMSGEIKINVPTLSFTNEAPVDCLIYVQDPQLSSELPFYGEDVTGMATSIAESFTVFKVNSSRYADYASLVNRYNPITEDGVVNCVGDIYPSVTDLISSNGTSDLGYLDKFYKLDDDGKVAHLKNSYGRPIYLVMDYMSWVEVYGKSHIVSKRNEIISNDSFRTDLLTRLSYDSSNLIDGAVHMEPTAGSEDLLPRETAMLGTSEITGVELPALVDNPVYAVNNYPLQVVNVTSQLFTGMRLATDDVALELGVASTETLLSYLAGISGSSKASNMNANYFLPKSGDSFVADGNDVYTERSIRSAVANGSVANVYGFKFIIESLKFKVYNKTNEYPKLRPITDYTLNDFNQDGKKITYITSSEGYGVDGIVIPNNGYGQVKGGAYEYPGMFTTQIKNLKVEMEDEEGNTIYNDDGSIAYRDVPYVVKSVDTLTFGQVDPVSAETELNNPFYVSGSLRAGSKTGDILTLCDTENYMPLRTIATPIPPDTLFSSEVDNSYICGQVDNPLAEVKTSAAVELESLYQDIKFEYFNIKYHSFAEADANLNIDLPNYKQKLDVLDVFIDCKNYKFDDKKTLRVEGSSNWIKFANSENDVYTKFFAEGLKLSAKVLTNNPKLVKNSDCVINLEDLYNKEVRTVTTKVNGRVPELALQSDFQNLFGYTRVCTLSETNGVEGEFEGEWSKRLANGVRYTDGNYNRFIKSDFRPDYSTLACNPSGKLLYFGIKQTADEERAASQGVTLCVDSNWVGDKEYFPGCSTSVQSAIYDLENVFADCKFYKSSGEVVSLFEKDFEVTNCIVQDTGNKLTMIDTDDYIGFYRLLPTDYQETYAQSLYGKLSFSSHSILSSDTSTKDVWAAKDTSFEIEFDLGKTIEITYTSKFKSSNYMVLRDKDNKVIANIYLQKPITSNDLLVISEV